MSLITRYLVRELVYPFLVTLLLFTGLMLLERLLDLTELIVNHGVSILGVVAVVLMRIPATFQITVPMALVIAAMMTFGRMMADHEITALRAAGYPLHGLMLPPLVLGGMLSVFLLGIHQYGLPQLAAYQEQYLQQLKKVNPVGLMRPRTYLNIDPYTIYAESVDGSRMRNVYLEDRSGERTQIVYSRRGRWFRRESGQYELRLRNGTLHQEGDEGRYRVLNFERQVVQFRPEASGSVETKVDQPSLGALYDRYVQTGNRLRRFETRFQEGRISERRYRRAARSHREAATRFHQTLAVPFACFFLVLTTAPLSMWVRQIGRVVNFFLAMGLIFLYYLAMSAGQALAEMGWMPAAPALWAGNLIFGLVGIGLYVWLVRKGG